MTISKLNFLTQYVNPNRNTLIEKTKFNNFNEENIFTSSEEKIFLSVKGKLDEIVLPEQVMGEYNYLSDKAEIENNGKIDIDIWTEKEQVNIENAIKNNAKHTLKWLTGLSYTNYPDHIHSKAETIIFTYAIQHGIYSEAEINSIKFDHGETKEEYIKNYGVSNQDELLEKLKKLGEEETEKLREYKKNNPEEKSYLGSCSGTCC